jgi:hypothetical protein
MTLAAKERKDPKGFACHISATLIPIVFAFFAFFRG